MTFPKKEPAISIPTGVPRDRMYMENLDELRARLGYLTDESSSVSPQTSSNPYSPSTSTWLKSLKRNYYIVIKAMLRMFLYSSQLVAMMGEAGELLAAEGIEQTLRKLSILEKN
jgi:hypothetical protein